MDQLTDAATLRHCDKRQDGDRYTTYIICDEALTRGSDWRSLVHPVSPMRVQERLVEVRGQTGLDLRGRNTARMLEKVTSKRFSVW